MGFIYLSGNFYHNDLFIYGIIVVIPCLLICFGTLIYNLFTLKKNPPIGERCNNDKISDGSILILRVR